MVLTSLMIKKSFILSTCVIKRNFKITERQNFFS